MFAGIGNLALLREVLQDFGSTEFAEIEIQIQRYVEDASAYQKRILNQSIYMKNAS